MINKPAVNTAYRGAPLKCILPRVTVPVWGLFFAIFPVGISGRNAPPSVNTAPSTIFLSGTNTINPRRAQNCRTAHTPNLPPSIISNIGHGTLASAAKAGLRPIIKKIYAAMRTSIATRRAGGWSSCSYELSDAITYASPKNVNYLMSPGSMHSCKWGARDRMEEARDCAIDSGLSLMSGSSPPQTTYPTTAMGGKTRSCRGPAPRSALGRFEPDDRRPGNGSLRRIRDGHQITIRSTSSRLTSSRRRS
jgi:hypothetical protein